VLSAYAPLQQYLQRRLQRPVLLVTAPDMQTFVERTQRGMYAYLVTAPHFARYAQVEAGYQPFLRVDRTLYGTLVVGKDSAVHSIGNLRGKVVATPDKLAIVSMLGTELLRSHGLQPGKDVEIRATTSHNSAVLSVQRGEAAAAVTSNTALKQMPAGLRDSVKELATTAQVPHLMFLANRHIPEAEVERIASLLREFAQDSPEGKAFISNTGYVGLRKPTSEELKRLDPFVQDLKNLLNVTTR
jgi:phosphonate transport system substrate-binding protein